MAKRSPAGPLEACVGWRTTTVWTPTLSPALPVAIDSLFATGRYAQASAALDEPPREVPPESPEYPEESCKMKCHFPVYIGCETPALYPGRRIPSGGDLPVHPQTPAPAARSPPQRDYHRSPRPC